jgi:hypothetical protein
MSVRNGIDGVLPYGVQLKKTVLSQTWSRPRGIRLSKQKTSNKIDGAGEPAPERKLSKACT